MLGREAYHRPFVLSELQRSLGGAEGFEPPSREALLERMARYAQRQIAQGDRLSTITRHMLGLYAGRARRQGLPPPPERRRTGRRCGAGSAAPAPRPVGPKRPGAGQWSPVAQRSRSGIIPANVVALPSGGARVGGQLRTQMGKDIELAILFADVVGSTRLYELMGDLRARDMVSICIDVMRSATEQRNGTVIKTMGDEVMATFPSADEALNAAGPDAAADLDSRPAQG